MGLPERGRRPLQAALFFAALAASVALLSGCTKPVAQVDGTSLPESEFLKLCETATRVSPQQGTVGMQVLQQWIGATLMAKEARKLGVYPSEEDLNKRVEEARRQAAYGNMNLEEELRKQGRDLAAFKRELLNNMVTQNVLFHGVTVSDEDVRKAFDQQKKNFTQPEQVEISQITLDSEKAKNDAVADLAANAQFPNVATTRSKDQFARSGGRVPLPLPRQIGPGQPVAQQAVDAAFKLQPGQVSDPIKVGATWVIVRLEKKTEAKEPNLEDFKEAIRGSLREQKARQSPRMQENQQKLMDATSGASIVINRPEYKILEQQFKSAPASTGPAAGAPLPGDTPPPPPGS